MIIDTSALIAGAGSSLLGLNLSSDPGMATAASISHHQLLPGQEKPRAEPGASLCSNAITSLANHDREGD